jgi:hypothetical protein
MSYQFNRFKYAVYFHCSGEIRFETVNFGTTNT